LGSPAGRPRRPAPVAAALARGPRPAWLRCWRWAA